MELGICPRVNWTCHARRKDVQCINSGFHSNYTETITSWIYKETERGDFHLQLQIKNTDPFMIKNISLIYRFENV